MRYSLRTLLILLALLPPVLAGAWWSYGNWRAVRESRLRQQALRAAVTRLKPDQMKRTVVIHPEFVLPTEK